MKRKYGLLLAVAFLAGLVLRGWISPAQPHGAGAAVTDASAATEWTCSMHPQIRQPKPGLCPICAMDLIPAGGGGVDPGPRAIAMSAAARERAGIETAVAKRGPADAKIRLAGTLAYADTHRRAVALVAEGQLRRLHANTPGLSFHAGAPLAELYSPDVYAAAQELISLRSAPSASASAARRKLALLGVGADQIEAIAQAAHAPETYTLTSPIDGVVLSVDAREGAWMMGGGTLLEIADPSVLWLHLDVYEQHAENVRVGQKLAVSVDALPGASFEAEITFVPPELDPMTRSLKVRAELPNPDGRLKPGLYARAVLDARLADDALLVPASAVLLTGTRAMVFVQAPDDPSVFESRVVETGPRAGGHYIIREGLAEGERVATRGALRVDSTLQLLGKPSMMGLPSDDGKSATRPQTHCPIIGGAIDREVFVDYRGLRIYFCCPGCDEDFLKDPEAMLSRMRAEGIEPEKAPLKNTPHNHQH
ncbi:MAG TPA: efflux RND transporter periplasmic adaptor subunit [Kiritimatiellia bacterium]|nr:efflux RND transporter periplasmic adaptor subunit [Kiritimatiellia bacterium]